VVRRARRRGAHATWWDPTNTELHLAGAHGAGPAHASRRLTFEPGPDDHALFAPGSGQVVWSKRAAGRYAVVSASLRSGHGALLLGAPLELAVGGAAWVAPAAWSPDARSLVLVRGNPFRPREAVALDLATGERRSLGWDAAGGTPAAFNADGGFLLLAAARRQRAAGLLPASAGFLLAPLAERAARDAPLFRTTQVRAGEPWGEGAPLALGEVGEWGEPTGVALLPEGKGPLRFVLGQRRAAGAVVEERLLLVTLACGAGRRG
jgi:hypothetical protein